MQNNDIEALRAGITTLESQRAQLGDLVVDLALAPLHSRLASLLRPVGVRHRQVTVLFADVVGSTALAQGLDAEDTLAVLSAALQRMAAIVEAHQGRVLRFTGDGVKAAFGMDETREDDAERAVRAGLAIQAAGREQAEAAIRLHRITDFAVRVGVHSGDVALGAGVEADSTAMGAAVNIAARMEQSAPPGGLRMSHDTFSQVRGLFEVESQALLQVKGVDAPMQTYLVRAALERSTANVERGLQGLATPMVGRQTELQRLLDSAAQARSTRQLQAVTLLGDAGLGKSRLLREFKAALASDTSSDAAGCKLLTVRAQPDGQLRPWGLLRSVLAVQCGVADTDSADVARRKVVDGLSPHFAERGERQAQLIGQLSGLDFADSPNVKGLDPRTLRDQALAAFIAYLQALAAPGEPLLVLLVEDLHWCDDSSLDLLQHLLAHLPQRAAELPLQLVMTARPALLARRPEWLQATFEGATSVHLQVQLQPLPAAQGDELAQALLQRTADVPPRLLALLIKQAEGNPYYMEELVRRLIDDGVISTDGAHWEVKIERLDTLRLPTTLVGLLQARLDALPAAQRQAARQASIIGHVFWDDALQALDTQAPHALPALQRTAYVREHERSDFEGTPERQFDHHLLHQVTYDTLLKAERKLGHGAAARWLAERTQGRGAEFLAMTGEHAERAGETALAIDCFEQAGAEAQRRFANTAATTWLRRAVTLLGDTQPARAFKLLNSLEKIADTVANRAVQEALHAELATLLERHPDDTLQCDLWFSIGMLAQRRSEADAAERHTLRALELAERCGAAKTAALSHGQLGFLKLVDNKLPEAQGHVAAGLQWAGRMRMDDEHTETECMLLLVSAMVSNEFGHLDEARQTALAVLSRGEALARPRLQLGALDALMGVAEWRGRWDEVIALEERALTLAQDIGATSRIALAQQHLAQAAEALGNFDTAMRWHEQLLPSTRAFGDRRVEVASLQHLGSLQRQRGDLSAAVQWHRQAQTLYEALGNDRGACEAAACAALCETLAGRTDAAVPTVNRLLQRLQGDLVECRTHETMAWRWACQQVLANVGDERAAELLEQLFADVQARAAELTDAADRDRLIQALPVFRAIVAAQAQRGTLTRPARG